MPGVFPPPGQSRSSVQLPIDMNVCALLYWVYVGAIINTSIVYEGMQTIEQFLVYTSPTQFQRIDKTIGSIHTIAWPTWASENHMWIYEYTICTVYTHT